MPISQRLERIATQAREYPDMAFTTLAHHLDVAMLAHAFRSLNPQSAPGVDRVTWRTYKNNLETNLETLYGLLTRFGDFGANLLILLEIKMAIDP
jgi:hypothetical protein